jgi:hypothetical protein
MAFNPATAKPKRFNPSTAKPAEAYEQQAAFNAAPGDIPEPGQPEQPNIANIPSPPFGVSYNLFRGAKTGEDIGNNARKMGFEVVPAADGGVLMKRGEEVYRYDPDSMWSGFVSSVRPTAQTIGNVAGAVATAPAAAAAGPFAPAVTVAGSSLGGVAGGQGADALVQMLEPSGAPLGDQLGQLGQDAMEQTAASVGGDIVGRLAGKAVQAGGQAVAAMGRGKDALKARIEPTMGVDTPVAQPSEKSYEQLVDAIKAGKTARAATAVKPDIALKQLAESEGVYLNPSHYSKNPVYIETEQAMKSKPGSMLNSREQAAIVRMGEVAEDIKKTLGGYTDRAQLNSDYTHQIDSARKQMLGQENILYGRVNDAVPKGTKVNPKNTLSYIQGRIDELGGSEYLTKEEAAVYNRLRSGKVNHALLNETRQQVGEAYQQEGPFKNASSRILDNLYGAMAQDQAGVARVMGVDDLWQLANKVTTDRKGLEENLTKIYRNANIGQGMDLPLAARLDAATANLIKGSSNDFKKVMAIVPANTRQAAAATALDNLFTNGARNKNGSIGQGFVAAYETLQKNKDARDQLYQYIPKDSQERLENLYRMAKGVYGAKKWENTSGTARAMLANMDKDPSTLTKLYDFGRKAGAAETMGNAVGVPGVGTAVTVATTLAAGAKTPASKAADALISSPAFEDAVIEYAKGDSRKAGEKLMQSKMYQKWLAEQPESIRLRVGATGLFSWLFGSQSTDTPTPTEQPSSPP